MTIEIRELVIKATVSEPREAAREADRERDEQLRADLVDECVEQVLRILREQRER